MVFDNLKNCENYYGINKNMGKAFDFIKKAVAENLPAEKYEIDGKELYAIVQEYTTKSIETAKFEGHQNYIDIQFIMSGNEIIKVKDIDAMTSKVPYNPEKDLEFYEDTDDCTVGAITAGEYGIFMPQDIHMPGLSPKSGATEVKKIVVKIRV